MDRVDRVVQDLPVKMAVTPATMGIQIVDPIKVALRLIHMGNSIKDPVDKIGLDRAPRVLAHQVVKEIEAELPSDLR